MTLTTFDTQVPARQLKNTLPIVVKHQLFPSVRFVTRHASSFGAANELSPLRLPAELRSVHILMTALTCGRRSFILRRLISTNHLRRVARLAAHLRMFTDKRKTRLRVIETLGKPIRSRVARRAALLRHFFRELSAVLIFVAALAVRAREVKYLAPLGVSRMTLLARRRDVRTCECKSSLIVHHKCERRRSKSERCVAVFARAVEPLRELPLMIVGMTITTPIVCQLQRLPHRRLRTALVALFARHRFMPTDELERRQVMIEFPTHLRRFPILWRMATLARLRFHELRMMRRSVARRAITKRLRREHERRVFCPRCHRSVALATHHCGMFANKRELRLRVIERLRDRRPLLRRVTTLAIRAHRRVVFVPMAAHARRAQTEIRCATLLVHNLENRRVRDIFLRMAIVAFNRRVLTRPRKPRQRVVERTIVELHGLRAATEMFLVALHARLRRVAKMKPVLCVDDVLNLRMTRRAFLPADFISRLMTLQAVVHPFQLLMRLRQVARRKLCTNVFALDSSNQQDQNTIWGCRQSASP